MSITNEAFARTADQAKQSGNPQARWLDDYRARRLNRSSSHIGAHGGARAPRDR